mmetsp:Transcript_57648/g.161721  ORF Transcript_57648/g.161721 Transcript_57648/m.161721 type:complete len:225 (+) Transcript_57648:49-723(+)|eukprot:CAMPEP_0176199162 /NCGR_PEP_ID=MMETSP0121_2-20121125/8418_1 /TAXON_ID=160619 /ORGANISM="Kryptoperidinium foliaceum, Strain CCMP 1326" /LENGTH=224 /DNA_ID=CAMNT_0017538019 /DNA_START=61 /DNA_END=735 /DNA_ORIENTATION=-
MDSIGGFFGVSPSWAPTLCLAAGGLVFVSVAGWASAESTKTKDRTVRPDGAQSQSPSCVEEPAHLLCPITLAIMRDPVFVVHSGNTYDRGALLRYWGGLGEARDPLTNMRLPSREVRTNWGTRRDVHAFLDEHPTLCPDGWGGVREMLPMAPEPEPAEQLGEVGLPDAVRAHCAGVAEAHDGHIPEQLLGHLARYFGVEAERLREAFPPHGAPAAGPRAQEVLA